VPGTALWSVRQRAGDAYVGDLFSLGYNRKSL
jgi:hypothetical protein